MKQIILILLINLLIIGCECVPDVNSPKQIDPEESAKVAFVNIHENYSSLNVESDDIAIIDELNNNEQESSYKNLASGITYIKMIDNENSIGVLNFSVDLEKGEYYTLFIFGSGSRAEALLVKDNKPNETIIRFINLTSIVDRNLEFDVEDHTEMSVSLGSREFSEEIGVNENSFNISLRESLNGSLSSSLVTDIFGFTNIIAYGNDLNNVNMISIRNSE